MKRILVLGLIVGLAVAGAWWYTRPRPQTLVLTGTVDGNEVVVASKITGRIDKLAVQDGQWVKAGDLVAVLDQAELRADDQAADEQIAQAQADTRQSEQQADLLAATLPAKVRQAAAQAAQAEAQLSQAQAQERAAQAALAKSQDNFNRIQPLVEKGVNPPQDLVNAQADLDSAQADRQAAADLVQANQRAVTAAQAALADAQHQLQQVAVQRQNTAVLQAAARVADANRAAAAARLGQTYLYAPVSGIVTLRAAREGEVVNPGNPVITIFDLSDTWVDADVEETYADLVPMGATLAVRLPSGAETRGPVIYKAVEADYATQRDVSRTKRDIKTVAIRVRVDNAQGRLPLGMTAWVLLPVPALPPAPAVQTSVKQ